MIYGTFAGPTASTPSGTRDPLHLTFGSVRAGSYLPGAGCPDGLHYDVKGNLWIAAGRLSGMLQIDPRGLIVGFVPLPNGDPSATNFAFGGPDNQTIYAMGATTGTFWRFKAPYPGLIGPGGARLAAQK
jgi:sugar lactone lactonase YvrE